MPSSLFVGAVSAVVVAGFAGAWLLSDAAAGSGGRNLGVSTVASASSKSDLQTRYDMMKAAMAQRDGAAIGSMLAPDFVGVDVSGQIETGPQMIAEVNGLQPDPNKVSRTTLISVSQTAAVATVDQRYEMKTRKVGADGAAHRIELVTLSTDTWIKPDGAWLLQRTVTNEITYFIDGKLAAHKFKS